MIIWIDGTYGVGKTTVAMRLKEKFLDDNIELLESDYYSNEVLKYLVEEAEANNSFLQIKGTLPQNNIDFIKAFREMIEEKFQKENVNFIVDMALTMKECKEELFDYLKNNGVNMVYIILTADEDTIRKRIRDDGNRMKEIALEWLVQNIVFLDKNFPDAIRIKTDNRSVDDVVAEIMDVI
ncbi:MAG: AAA family ATPase [Clostridium sp.]|nr:AAA family ATPase [Clostridium sp.]